MFGKEKCSRGVRSSPRSSPTTVRPALVSSRAMMLPVQPMPTMTASTSFKRVVMSGSPLRKVRDGLRFHLITFVAIFIDQGGIDRRQAWVSDHPPARLVASAAVDRIGEEALHCELQQ